METRRLQPDLSDILQQALSKRLKKISLDLPVTTEVVTTTRVVSPPYQARRDPTALFGHLLTTLSYPYRAVSENRFNDNKLYNSNWLNPYKFTGTPFAL